MSKRYENTQRYQNKENNQEVYRTTVTEEIPDADELVHDTFQDQAETVIEENIYSLEDAEDTFNANVADVTEDIETAIDENTYSSSELSSIAIAYRRLPNTRGNF